MITCESSSADISLFRVGVNSRTEGVCVGVLVRGTKGLVTG